MTLEPAGLLIRLVQIYEKDAMEVHPAMYRRPLE